jgi:threonine synthase
MPAPSYIDPRNGDCYPLDVPRWCSDARTPLLISPQSGISREDIDRTVRSIWRYRAALPIDIHVPISMGEGCTPLLSQSWGELRPLFKLEWFSPTGSFKDRGSSVMLSYLRQQGIDAVLEDSSGNGGSSIAGFGAAGGMRVKILAPAYTSPAKIAQVRAYGAQVQLVDGPREESEAEAIRQSGSTFFASHNWQPFFLEGTKLMAYEIWEDLGYKAPDNIVVPVGAGSLLLGFYFGFKELLSTGQIQRMPRLFAAQPLNCSPVVAGYTSGTGMALPREVRKTIAEGTAIRNPLRLREILRALAESQGGAVAIAEAEIVEALACLASAGLFVEPTSATAAAALDRLLGEGAIKTAETTIVVLTGTGLKAAMTVAELLASRNQGSQGDQ